MLAMRQAQERQQRLEQAIAAAVGEWSLAEVVTALRAMRGIDLISAATLLAEIGDLSRFRTPTELMAYLGLVPSDHQSRQPACSAHVGGVRLELSASTARGVSQAAEGRCRAGGGARDCLEGAVPALPALSRADQEEQAQDRRHRGGRP